MGHEDETVETRPPEVPVRVTTTNAVLDDNNSRPEQKPGAVHMPGTHREEDAVDSEQHAVTGDTDQADSAENVSMISQLVMAVSTEDEYTDNESGPSQVVVSVTAELADGMSQQSGSADDGTACLEEEIEEMVRQRIIQEAAQADVVTPGQYNENMDAKSDSTSNSEESNRSKDWLEAHRPKGVREKLFGNSRRSNVNVASTPECIRKRNVLKTTIKKNNATNTWVACIPTNQNAVDDNDHLEVERSTVNFSADTQEEAEEIARAMATPRLQPFSRNPICFVCKNKFAVFRKKQHCRNCGVCICNACRTMWPTKSIPETYNIKKGSHVKKVKVCIACDWLAKSFQMALIKGDQESAMRLYETGNVNLRTPFFNANKSEMMYPIHAAAYGGNFNLLKWLTTIHCCPLKEICKKTKKSVPLLTSRGFSVLGIALEEQHLEIVCCLVGSMGMKFEEESNQATTNNHALAEFTTELIHRLPADFFRSPAPA